MQNTFGLSRLYLTAKPPSHDPEESISLQDLYELVPSVEGTPTQTDGGNSTFGRYPNESSFLLGDWYWNGGAQKSQQGFKQLIDIVASPTFKAEDVRSARWSTINKALGVADFDRTADEWEDDDSDAGWKRSPIVIDVPFHRQMKSSEGWRRHTIGSLYHRSIVSVIKEKLANTVDNQHFHYEPYTLLWKPTVERQESRVYGEIYTSPSFEHAHRTLQESPGEPGCQLPRCVVALMFWSDETHLTSFGKTKLWPVYMFFGNESKYRRCKPSLNLCNHLAYFESVSPINLSFCDGLLTGVLLAS